MRKINNSSRNQDGFASIVIALILIVVLALLTVGFAQLARREQQDALDKQLATQAYDAAESGVNDIDHIIQEAVADPDGATPSLAALTPSPPASAGINPSVCLGHTGSGIAPDLLPNPILNQQDSIGYRCVLLDLQPPTLLKTPVAPNTSWNTVFSTTEAVAGDTSAPLDSLKVSWSSVDDRSAATSTTGFEPATKDSWTAPAVLRVSITPLSDLNTQQLIENTYTAYMYPNCSGPGTVEYDTTKQGPVADASCTAANNTTDYSVTVGGLSGSPGADDDASYLISITDYYDSSTISVAAADTNGKPLNFVGGQAQVDVTGYAKEVSKRIQVRIPLRQPVDLPGYDALEAQNICKRLDTAPYVANVNPNGTTYESAGDGATPSGTDPCSYNSDHILPSN